MAEEFSSNQVIEITGASARQIQYWDEIGLICPAMKPVPLPSGQAPICRRYSTSQMIEVGLLNEAKSKGLALRARWSRLLTAIRVNNGRYLITDGKRFFYVDNDAALVQVILDMPRPSITLDLKEYREVNR